MRFRRESASANSPTMDRVRPAWPPIETYQKDREQRELHFFAWNKESPIEKLLSERWGRVQVIAGDTDRPVDAHCYGHRRLSRPGRVRLGRVHGLLLPPGADRSRDCALRAVWGGFLCRWKSEPGSARGSWQPLGHRSLCADRAAERLSTGLRGPEGVLDHRQRYHSLAWRRSLRCRWRAADLASLCARGSVQRPGRHPAWTQAGHRRGL